MGAKMIDLGHTIKICKGHLEAIEFIESLSID